MANVSLFFKRAKPTQILRTLGGSVSPIILDATIKETFSMKAEPTKHPVEDGADVTDHIILRPDGLSLSGVITEIPFAGLSGLVKSAGATVGATVGSRLGTKFGPGAGVTGAVGGALGAATGALGGSAVKSLADSIFGSDERVLGAVAAEFKKLKEARQPVDIQTGLQLYKSYVMTSCNISRDQKSGGSIKVDLEFEEMIFVESQTTTVAIPKVKGALNKSNNGRQSKDGLDANKTGRGSSLLKKIFGA